MSNMSRICSVELEWLACSLADWALIPSVMNFYKFNFCEAKNGKEDGISQAQLQAFPAKNVQS